MFRVGRPFIAAVESDSEPADIARAFDCGIVVEPGDREGMSQAIRRLHGDPAWRRRLADHARGAGLAYDRRHAVEAYRDVLEDAAFS